MNRIASSPILAFLLSFILVVIFTFPAILNMNSLLIGDGGDNYEYFSFQYIAAEKIKNLEWPFSHTDIMRYPVGFNFATGFESVTTVLTGALLSFVLGQVLAYNITIFLLYALNGFLSFILFKYISKSNLIASIGALIYGFSFFVIARSAGHINLFFIGGLTLFIYALLKIRDRFTEKNLVLLYSSGTLIVLSSFLYTIMFSVSFILILPLLAFFFKQEVKEVFSNFYKEKHRVMLIAVPFFLTVLFFSLPRAQALITGDYYRPDRSDYNSHFYSSPSIKDYLIPNTYLPLAITEATNGLNDSAKSIDKSVFLGWVEIALFMAFLIFYKDRKIKYFISSGALIFFILSLGYIIPETGTKLPYYFLHKLPLFSFIDEPSRFYPVMYLLATVGIVLFLKQTLNSNRKAKALIAIAILLLFIERLPFNFWIQPVFKDEEFAKKVREYPTEAVFDIPVSFTNSPYHILPYVYERKMVSGTFQWFADTDKPKSFIRNNGLTRFLCGDAKPVDSNSFSQNQKLVETLKENDITTIVVHKNSLEGTTKFYFPECANMRMQAINLLPQLLMVNPSPDPQILSVFYPVVPRDGESIIFPADGKFVIEGIEAYPDEWLPLKIFYDDQELSANPSFTSREGKIATSEPFLVFEVKKGSKLRFHFEKNHNLDYSFVKIWYRYETLENPSQLDSTGQILKVYEDDKAAVFRINY